MLKSLKIKNFRCFEEFDLPQLGRVNLLVGKNNSGKTSILEALHILNSPDKIKPFFDIIECRGESLPNEKDGSVSGGFLELRHFLSGHLIEAASSFDIRGTTDTDKNIKFSFCLKDIPLQESSREKIFSNKHVSFLYVDFDRYTGVSYVLDWEDTNDKGHVLFLPVNTPIDRLRVSILEESKSSRLVSLSLSEASTIISEFNQIVLTPKEETLYESLRIIEPGIERIATVGNQMYRQNINGGFVVSINKQRVPIGSMGYGIWRMLEITLAMVNIPGGTLLIDEIDTGLHFSVMIDLWKLICKTAEKLDIQVFATTHNSDCWKSLAEVANSEDIASEDITIHRIERGKKASIVFNEQEMAIAAERDIEVR
jgi:energy-coupling factor transporter ATP-binding protein EcfA2